MKKAFLGLVLMAAGCSAMPWHDSEFEEIVIDEPYLPSPLQDRIVPVESTITPEVYAIAATRVANRMLDETTDIYERDGTSFIYINQPQRLTDDLPDGVHYANKITRDIISGSNNYKIVNNPAEADYTLDAQIANIGTVEDPIVEYRLSLYDAGKNLINTWTEAVRQLKNDDRSWW